MVHSNALAALLVFANDAWYAYAGDASLTAIEDQQLAGAIMWVGASPVFLLTVLWLGYRWLDEAERQSHAESAARVINSSARQNAPQ